jgi:nudix-type nucleoside diphosphatase (YffH/AdpP family)
MNTITGIRTVYSGWSKLLQVQVRLKSGQEIVREVEDHGAAVAVLPYDLQRRTVMLVRLLRTPVLLTHGPEDMLETPAGLIEDAAAEDTALRESLEETGLRLRGLEPQGWVYTSPGLSTERIHLYLAPYTASDRVASGGGLESEQENIEVVETPAEEALALMDAGRIFDLKTLTLLLILRSRHPELFAAGAGA